MVGPGPGDAAYRRRLAELGRESRVVAAGDVLWLDGMRIDVDWPLPGKRATPPARLPARAINNVSIVLDVTFGEPPARAHRRRRAADRPAAAGRRASRATDSRSTCSRSRTTAARTATTDAFLEQMRPQVAIVSAGWGNPYGHPSPATVARLRERRRAGVPHGYRRLGRHLHRRAGPGGHARRPAGRGPAAAPPEPAARHRLLPRSRRRRRERSTPAANLQSTR